MVSCCSGLYSPAMFITTTIIFTFCIQVSLCNLNDFCNETVTCSVQNSFCDSSKVCQCNDTFYEKTETLCESISTLQVTGFSQQSSTLNSVTVTWTEPADTSAVTGYTVTWTPASTTNTNSADVTKGTATYSIPNLQSGTQYSVTVTTKIYYRTQTTVTPALSVKTKSALLESCVSNTDCGVENTDCYGSTCQCMLGFYLLNGACTSISTLQVTGLSQQTSTLNSVTVTWTEPTDTTSVVTGYTVIWSSTTGTELGHFDVGKGTTTYSIPNLQSGTQYSVTVTTKISYRSHTTVTPATTVKTKIKYNDSCTDEFECSNANAICIKTEPRRCLCKTGYFWNGDECAAVSLLKPVSVDVSVTGTTSLKVTWTSHSENFVTKYRITWSPATGVSSKETTSNTLNITDLTPGQLFTVTVFAVIIQEGREQSVSRTAQPKGTKPATPGPYMDSMSNKTAPNITLKFKKSDGIVTSYKVTLLGVGASNTYSSTQNITPPFGQEYQQVIFTRITAGQYYTLQITAYSNGLSSDMYTSDPIRASLTPPGVVSNLTVTDVTHSSMKTSWRKPAAPNGDITAYIITVISEDVCQQKIVFICNDCQNMMDLEDPSCKNVNKSTIEMKKAELNNDSIKFHYTIKNLHPFTNYTVDVFSHNELDAGGHNPQIYETKTKAADTPTEFKSSDTNSSSITLSWKPEPVRPGITNYNLTVFEKSETGDEYELMSSFDIKGWNEDSYVVVGLSSYWDYKFTLTASTSAGESSATSAGPIRTKQSAPKAVKTFTVTKIENNYTAVKVNYECPKQKDGRNGEIQTSKLTYSSSEPGALTGDKDIPNDGSCRFSLTVDVTPEHNYTFSVKLKTISFGDVSEINFYTSGGPPVLESVIRKPSKETLYERQFVMMVHPRSVYKNVAGHVKLAGVIVFRQDVYTAERRFRRNARSTDDYSSYTNWYISNLTDFKLPYRATNDSWVNKDLEVEKYMVGSMNCSTQKYSFCNGPLKSGTKYTAVLFACTDAGCQESAGIQFETKTAKSEKENQVSSAVIAVSVVAVILFLLLVILGGVFFWYVRRHRSKQESPKRNNHFMSPQIDQHEMSGPSNVHDGGQVGNLSNRGVSGYYNVPLSQQPEDPQQIGTSTFRDDGYVNARQAAGGNEYERLGPAAPSQNVYSKLTEM